MNAQLPEISDRKEIVVRHTIENLLREMQDGPLVLSTKTSAIDCYLREAILRLTLMPHIHHRHWAGNVILTIDRTAA